MVFQIMISQIGNSREINFTGGTFIGSLGFLFQTIWQIIANIIDSHLLDLLQKVTDLFQAQFMVRVFDMLSVSSVETFIQFQFDIAEHAVESHVQMFWKKMSSQISFMVILGFTVRAFVALGMKLNFFYHFFCWRMIKRNLTCGSVWVFTCSCKIFNRVKFLLQNLHLNSIPSALAIWAFT